MIKHVKFVSIPVRDQDKSLAFYTEKLGFRILTDQPFNGKQRWIEQGIPGGQTNVVLFTPDGHEDRIGGFLPATFHCDDVEATYEQHPPAKMQWGTFNKLALSENVKR